MTKIGTLVNFIPSTKAKSSEMNSNFTDVKTSVNVLYDEVGDITTLDTTDKTSAVAAINELVASLENTKQYDKTATLATGTWSSTGGEYQYTITDTDVGATDRVDVVADNADFEIAAAAVLKGTTSSAGSFIIHAKNLATDDIGITYYIMGVA